MIYRLHIENILTISEMDIDLSPGIEGFVGPNGIGKSNVLAALEGILNGTTPDMIKDGKKKGVIRLDGLDESGDVISSVTRTQSLGSSTLKGRNLPDDFTPHAYLSSLLDSVALNPVKLISEKPVEYLKKHLPLKAIPEDLPKNMSEQIRFDLDGNPLDECKKQCAYYRNIRLNTYKDMHHEKEVVAELKKELPPLPQNPLEFTQDDLKAEDRKLSGDLALIDSHNQRRDELERENKFSRQNIDDFEEKIQDFNTANLNHKKTIPIRSKEVENQIRDLEDKIAALKEDHQRWLKEVDHKMELNTEKITGFNERISKEMDDIDLANIKIAQIPVKSKEVIEKKQEEIQRKYDLIDERDNLSRRHEQVSNHEKAYLALKKRHSIEDELFKYFDKELPSKLIERCDLHVNGLTFEDNELYVEGRPIMRLSSSQRTSVLVKVVAAIAKNRGQIAVSVDGLEIYDKENREFFLNEMRDSGLKMIYTRHGIPEYDHETLIESQ